MTIKPHSQAGVVVQMTNHHAQLDIARRFHEEINPARLPAAFACGDVPGKLPSADRQHQAAPHLSQVYPT